MPHYRIIPLLILTAWVLTSCTVTLPFSAHGLERPLPTIGPVQQVTGISELIRTELTATTNCANIGDVITFTGRVTNESNHPLTITSYPPFDFVLRPANWRSNASMPVQHWSEISSDASSANPVLAPGETRTYLWQWIADAVYGQRGVNGIRVTFIIGEIPQETRPSGGPEVWVGVHTMPGGEVSEAGIECAALLRP